MAKAGPIVLIDDDEDDLNIYREVLTGLTGENSLVTFENATHAYEYLLITEDQPFAIICDVNLPGLSGLEFKKQVDSNEFLRRKSIPFIFMSTSVNQASVNKAYIEMSVQGFFKKPSSMDEMRRLFEVIIAYWKDCKHINSL